VLTGPGTADNEALMDWNESPVGPPPSAVKRVIEAAPTLHRYPRGLIQEVTGLVAAHLGVDRRQVLLTAGVDEAIEIALTLGDRGWGVEPGFDGYQDRIETAGKPFHGIPLGADWQPLADCTGLGEGDVVFLAQPANPTGNLFAPEWIDRVRADAGHVLLDETYLDFSSRDTVLDQIGDDPRLLVYRSFSKSFGLAGIRVGCLAASADVIARLAPVRRFMPIDAVSLHAAAGVLEDPDFVDRLVAHVLEARPALAASLRDSGRFSEVRDSEANFVLARLHPHSAVQTMELLDHAAIRVKDCEPLGLPGWLRVSVGSWDEQRRLGEALGSTPVNRSSHQETTCEISS
jgi:histidinol-phosphate aminotransferase